MGIRGRKDRVVPVALPASSPSSSVSAEQAVAERHMHDGGPRTFATEDEKIDVWCRQMLSHAGDKDMVHIQYVRGCARREADDIRASRPDLAAKLDVVAATLTAKLPEEMR